MSQTRTVDAQRLRQLIDHAIGFNQKHPDDMKCTLSAVAAGNCIRCWYIALGVEDFPAKDLDIATPWDNPETIVSSGTYT